MLKVHEVTTPTGALSPIYLSFEGGVLAMIEGAEALPLPDPSLDAVMSRFGAPLDPTADVTFKDALDLGGGRVLRHARHLSGYDVIARDYLVYETADREPLCALASTVVAALAHLAHAARSAAAT
jgi:hypothetical protein